MKKIIKKALLSGIKKTGNMMIPHTPINSVSNLIKKLHPLKTEKKIIRLGPDGDGGYLLPNDLENIEACFSPGVCQLSGFEEDCSKYGMKLFLADNSVDKPSINNPDIDFNFIKKHIGCMNNSKYITLDNWVNSCLINNNSDLLLQMDIEGAEYEVFINTSESLMKRIRVMAIEFHNLDMLWNPQFFKTAKIVFNKILQTHSCVHIHPNNVCEVNKQFGIEIPQVAEFTFLRKDRDNFDGFQSDFPQKLDFDNTTTKPHVKLPITWFTS